MNYEFKSVLFLGVGGISMHQLALAFKSMGVRVFGYDAHLSKYTKICEDNGVKITNVFNKDFCHVDLCVKTGAIKKSKYLTQLKKLNCPIVDRAEVLGWLTKKFKTIIAVAGTHGKTTTASLIYEILRQANKIVSCHIGAEVFNPRFNLGDDFLVVEACEFNKSFLSLFPNIAVVTNIEAEHMDSYGSLFNLRSSFLTFLKRAQHRFVFLEDSTKFLIKNKNITFINKLNLNISPKIKGEHNLKNISLAYAVCKKLGVQENIILKAINSFTGVARRYEHIGNINSSRVYIDYAHHPTEVNAFVSTFIEQYKNNLIIFQPHTYSRTKTFLKDFIKVLKNVENLIIYKEYPAREKRAAGITAKQLYEELKKYNANVKYCASINCVEKYINNHQGIAFVGAGDINLVAEKLINKNKN